MMFPVPAIVVPVVAYTVIAPFGVDLTAPLIGFMSGEDLLVAAAIISAATEIWRSTAASPQVARHLVASLVLLLLVIVEWFEPWNRNGTMALLTLATLIDVVVSGYVAFVVKGQNNIWVSGR